MITRLIVQELGIRNGLAFHRSMAVLLFELELFLYREKGELEPLLYILEEYKIDKFDM